MHGSQAMTDQAKYQRALKAYDVATVHGMTSNDIWLKSLSFIYKQLEEAKAAREKKDFMTAHDCHKRILPVVGTLQGAISPADGVVPDAEWVEAYHFLNGYYNQLRAALVGISSCENAAKEYDELMNMVMGLHNHLKSIIKS